MGAAWDVARGALDVFAARNYDELDRWFHEDAEFGAGGRSVKGLEGIREVLSKYYAGFPDIYHTITDYVEAEDAIAVQLEVAATHAGTFVGELGEFPPTGRKIAWPSAAFIKLRDGKVERWDGYIDLMAIHRAAGFVPPSEREPAA
jgi:predicted ester cyclase